MTLISDNSTIVISKQRDAVSLCFSLLVQEAVSWAEKNEITLQVMYILEKKIALAYQLTQGNRVLKAEWSPLARTCKGIFYLWHMRIVDMFATNFSIYVSP